MTDDELILLRGLATSVANLSRALGVLLEGNRIDPEQVVLLNAFARPDPDNPPVRRFAIARLSVILYDAEADLAAVNNILTERGQIPYRGGKLQ